MTDRHIHYRSGYKYQLAEDFSIVTGIRPQADIDIRFIALDRQGRLLVRSGYAWDGTSGPVFDTPQNLRASLVHDALYQLLRLRKLAVNKHKDQADRLFRAMCREDGVPAGVAQVYYAALKRLGKPSTEPRSAKPVWLAPGMPDDADGFHHLQTD
jgi:hypothetical protein